MSGTLYVVATPIGNLSEMSPRAVETLRFVDLIAAEDTRNTLKLLNHFDIKTPQTSNHKFNEEKTVDRLVGELKEGKNIAVVSDAGTP
ncbi:MAG: 16S rRNA (cytidine(1402)-2'-O)-methyltransferase, partial [Lachnospiraceae bacterium]|nr:16S rRNA (cytidine(1402)-2'-O)-methyltransferase [Lachnospiraceae bacterium]